MIKFAYEGELNQKITKDICKMHSTRERLSSYWGRIKNFLLSPIEEKEKLQQEAANTGFKMEHLEKVYNTSVRAEANWFASVTLSKIASVSSIFLRGFFLNTL
jgi:hypothetical protein